MTYVHRCWPRKLETVNYCLRSTREARSGKLGYREKGVACIKLVFSHVL